MRLRHGILYLCLISILFLVTAVAAAGIDYVFWRVYVGHLKGTEQPRADTFETIPNVPADTARRLGRIYTDKKTSFVNFDRRKPPGVIRIGAFGDSFTYGDEVDERNDYPTQLQRILKEAGISNVEVLNFGTSWYGFTQTHIMWNEVGRYYNLDYILLGPATFFADRETRFNHTFGLSPYYLHSRYILDGQSLRLVDVPGETHSERFDNYYSFIPDSRLRAYDRGDPPFLAAVLPNDSYVGNPFYYSKLDSRDEAAEIQKRLLQDMARTGIPIITGVYPWISAIKPATRDLSYENLCVTQFNQLLRFPYRAQYDHNSPTGNALLARQYLSVLSGRPVDARILHTINLKTDAGLPDVREPLSSFDGMYVRIGDADAALFAPSYPPLSRAKRYSFLRDDKIRALIALKAPQNSVLDGVFLAFASDISATAPVSIVMQSAQGTKTAALGPLRPFANGVTLGQADLPGLAIRDPSFADRRIEMDASALSDLLGDVPAGAKLQVMIGDKVALEGAVADNSGTVALLSPDAELLIVRSASSSDLSADRGLEKGTVGLVLERDTESISIPIAQWWIEHRKLQPPAACSTRPLPIPVPVTIAITASGDQFEGAPQLRVYLNDKPVGDALVTGSHEAGEWQTYIFNAQSEGRPTLLRLALANDKFDNATAQDRNLYIRDITIGTQKLRLKDAIDSDEPAAWRPDGSRGIFSGSLTISLDADE